MIPIKGKLTVRSIKGKKGAFMVGELTTDVGTFKVKSAILDQFEPGTYSGTFLINQIYLDNYMWFGAVRTELSAKVHEINLEEEDLNPPREDERPPEPDPAERTDANGTTSVDDKPVSAPPVASAPSKSPAAKPKKSAPAPADRAEGEAESDQEFFGAEIYEAVLAGGPVKLDPTIDRTKFRAQRDRLKNLGFTFEASSQSWSKKN